MSSAKYNTSPQYNSPKRKVILTDNVPSPNVRRTPSKQKKTYSDICKEYELMRNYFGPSNQSPNLFMSKLDNRFRMYFMKCKDNNIKSESPHKDNE